MLDNLTRDDLPDGVMDIVDSIGIDAFKDLMRLAGGSILYGVYFIIDASHRLCVEVSRV